MVPQGSIVDITVNENTEKMVPMLIGKSKEDAEKVLSELGIKYKIEGEGYITSQSIKAKTIVTEEVIVLTTDRDFDKVEESVINNDKNNKNEDKNKN